MNGILALSWFDHRRTRGLCAGLGIELALVDTRYRGLRRYLTLGLRTLALLIRRRPRVLLVQNPSLVLSALVLVLRPLLGFRVVIDAHNEAVEPYENPQGWIKSLSRWVIRRADLTIVTNRQLALNVTAQGGTPFVLPDLIPQPPAAREPGARNPQFHVALIATFAKDEPIAPIFEAVRELPLQMSVTGNSSRLKGEVAALAPANVHFTGFLEETDYWALLRAVDAVVDLTLKPDCLVCGAYEALAVGKPMLLSDNAASIELFGDSAVFTDNTKQGIREGLERLMRNVVHLQTAALRKREELRSEWQRSAAALAKALQPPDGRGHPEQAL